jgi:hypothetical protein
MGGDDDLDILERRMAEAVAAEDFEAAARLRDRIAVLKAEGDQTLFRRQTPGRMGLGTDQQVLAPPKGWKPPRKPDLMTANIKPRGGKR